MTELYYKFRMFVWKTKRRFNDFWFVFGVNVKHIGVVRAAIHAAQYVIKY